MGRVALRRVAIRTLVSLFGIYLAGCSETETKTEQGEPLLNAAEMHDKAVAAYTAQDWAESEKYYVELSRAVPSNVEPWFKLGNIYARTDRPELAIRAYRECVIRNPRHAKAWHNMGIIQLRQARGSFTQLQQFVNESDPLYEKSARISSGIETLIESTD